MASQIATQRDLSATKLSEMVRQLRRYLINGKSVRIIEQRSRNVETEKDELIEYHHRYAEKTGVSVDDDTMKDFITDKLDSAEDVLNEATDVLDGLNKTDVEETKKIQIAKMTGEAKMIEELMLYIVDEVSKIIAVENPTQDDIITVENYLSELRNKEEILKACFDTIRTTVDEKETVDNYSNKETTLKLMLSKGPDINYS